MTNIANKGLLLAVAALATGCANWHPFGAEEKRTGMVADWYSHQTVYTHTTDTANPSQSNCDAYCASMSPPHRPAAGERPAGDFTIIKRADGSPQWAYKGMPLYTCPKDTKTGDKNCDGAGGGVMRVAQ